ncbi:ATP-binding cassette domain-containing protein [Candidatus Peregrinibacteria bacterium]|nr:ATP-binding cassette domain-containing protein [Candidatus Peregrinibacteria bacterium]
MNEDRQTKQVVRVQNLSKTFLIPHEKRNTLKESLVRVFKKRTFEKFDALNDVSFNINKGEFVGIVGKNGSGKSTLLRIITNIYRPTSGKVQTKGKIAPFLELGIGFQNDLTAKENVRLNATLLGLTREEIRQKYDKIVEFAELENFMDLRVKNYSSGMRARLAFAIAKEADADIYLCDEVLAVGDESFQKKCLKVFEDWKKQNKTIILVTHDAETVKKMCTRAILLSEGKIEADDYPEKVIEKYHRLLATTS